MTPIAFIYLMLGVVSLLWPLALLFFRRQVLSAQWLMAIALFFLAISFILYSCLFNVFLKGEYLLVILFMIFSMLAPPCAILAVTVLTNPQGIGRPLRGAFIPVGIMAFLLALSVIIGGPDMYRLWIEHGANGDAHIFFPNSWRYNTIVIVHYYLFSIVLTLEAVMLAAYTIARLRRYKKTIREYYTPDSQRIVPGSILFAATAILGICVTVSLMVYPFNAPRPVNVTLLLCIVEGVAISILGYRIYRLNYGAEMLAYQISHSTHRLRKNLSLLGKEISGYVEEGGYLDPDLSVFNLASRFKVSQDQVVDAIHKAHGVSFADYVDALRVEHASSLLSAADSQDNPDTLASIAHQCGYLNVESLQKAYRKVMHVDIRRIN